MQISASRKILWTIFTNFGTKVTCSASNAQTSCCKIKSFPDRHFRNVLVILANKHKIPEDCCQVFRRVPTLEWFSHSLEAQVIVSSCQKLTIRESSARKKW